MITDVYVVTQVRSSKTRQKESDSAGSIKTKPNIFVRPVIQNHHLFLGGALLPE